MIDNRVEKETDKVMKQYVEINSLWKCDTCFYYQNNKCSTWCECGEAYRAAYNKLTIIEGEIVKTAHWIISSDGYYPYCSNCKSEPDCRKMTKYCPECGARMTND